MLDIKKLRKECMQTIHSYTREQLLEWVEMDRKRMALVDMQNGIDQTAPKPRKAVTKLNGASQSMAKPRKVAVRQKKETVS